VGGGGGGYRKGYVGVGLGGGGVPVPRYKARDGFTPAPERIRYRSRIL
jgi:hypothetical protein